MIKQKRTYQSKLRRIVNKINFKILFLFVSFLFFLSSFLLSFLCKFWAVLLSSLASFHFNCSQLTKPWSFKYTQSHSDLKTENSLILTIKILNFRLHSVVIIPGLLINFSRKCYDFPYFNVASAISCN